MQGARCRSIATLLSLLAIGCIAAAAAHARPGPPILLVAGDSQHARSTASGDVYVVRADGTGLRRLHPWPHDGRVYGAYSARWSPDGRAIGLMLACWCGDPCGRLAKITTDGRLHTVPVHADIKSASWSSDWQAALTVYNADELWTISMDSGKGTRICCSRGHSASDPAWSPDAQELVVSTSRGLVRMTRDGKNVVPLTFWSRDEASEWSPDGRSIAFIRRSRCSGQFECGKPDYIYTVSRNGKVVRPGAVDRRRDVTALVARRPIDRVRRSLEHRDRWARRRPSAGLDFRTRRRRARVVARWAHDPLPTQR